MMSGMLWTCPFYEQHRADGRRARVAGVAVISPEWKRIARLAPSRSPVSPVSQLFTECCAPSRAPCPISPLFTLVTSHQGAHRHARLSSRARYRLLRAGEVTHGRQGRPHWRSSLRITQEAVRLGAAP